MGGIPTDRHARVVAPARHGPEEAVPGIYAAGECACVSVHGANRLGGNSLLDILVFGRAAGTDILSYVADNPNHRPMQEAHIEPALERLARWERHGDGERVADVKAELRRLMEDHCGVFRDQPTMADGVEKLKALRERVESVRLRDHSQTFNTARIEALEMDNLVDVGMATILSALHRDESRGAHSRVDHPDRDDERWLKHSLYSRDGDRMDYKPVRTKPLTVESFPPKPRVY
jgi:succinate dehydrogenase / fumarate reductase flavoprotein subunit